MFYRQTTFTRISFSSFSLYFLFLSICFAYVFNMQAKTTLNFYIPAGATKSGKVFENIAMAFNEELGNSNQQVNVQISNNHQEILDGATIQSKTGIFILPIAQSVHLQNTDKVISLEPHLEKSASGRTDFLNRFDAKALRASYPERNGKEIFSLPFSRNTPLIFYNLNMLADIGLNADNLPTTWKDFKAVLLSYQKHDASKIPFLLGADWHTWILESMAFQQDLDPEYLSIDDSKVHSLVNYWSNLSRAGLVETNDNWNATLNSFKNGNYPIICFESGGLGFLTQSTTTNIAVGTLPNNGKAAVHYGGYNLLFSTNMTKDQQALAWKFVEFLYSPKIQAKIAIQTGNMPVIKAARQHANYRTVLRDDPFFRVAAESLQMAVDFSMSSQYIDICKTFKYDVRNELINQANQHFTE